MGFSFSGIFNDCSEVLRFVILENFHRNKIEGSLLRQCIELSFDSISIVNHVTNCRNRPAVVQLIFSCSYNLDIIENWVSCDSVTTLSLSRGYGGGKGNNAPSEMKDIVQRHGAS